MPVGSRTIVASPKTIVPSMRYPRRSGATPSSPSPRRGAPAPPPKEPPEARVRPAADRPLAAAPLAGLGLLPLDARQLLRRRLDAAGRARRALAALPPRGGPPR